MSKIPKVVKLETKGYHGIINRVDELLKKGLSYRKIASIVTKEFGVGVSYQSIRRYHLFKEESIKDSKTNKPSNEIHICIRPIKRHSLM